MCEVVVRGDVCRLGISGGRWLSTGINGGFGPADGAVNVTVPEDFGRVDLSAYAAERRRDVGFETGGPALLTAVDQADARCARAGPVTVVATAGLTNPASLPVPGDTRRDGPSENELQPPGTVNLLVGTDRALSDGPLASCLATAVEAKTATIQARTGLTGTTTDAVAVGCNLDGDRAAFVGSSTHVGISVRACVRDAVLASLEAVHEDLPGSVPEAAHGTATDCETTVFEPQGVDAAGGPPSSDG